MQETDRDNYYNLEDDTNMDDSGINFSKEYEYTERDDNPDVSYEQKKKYLAIKLMFKILLQPVEGWKSVRRERLKVENVQSNCFYPLLALLAISNFSSLYYIPTSSLSESVVKGIISFVSYFFGYFCILIVLNILLSNRNKYLIEEQFGKVFIIFSLSSLCFFSILMELLPMLWPVLIFLPLWTIYSMCKGIRFFKPDDKGFFRFTVTICLCVITIPLLIDILLNFILPK